MGDVAAQYTQTEVWVGVEQAFQGAGHPNLFVEGPVFAAQRAPGAVEAGIRAGFGAFVPERNRVGESPGEVRRSVRVLLKAFQMCLPEKVPVPGEKVSSHRRVGPKGGSPLVIDDCCRTHRSAVARLDRPQGIVKILVIGKVSIVEIPDALDHACSDEQGSSPEEWIVRDGLAAERIWSVDALA